MEPKKRNRSVLHTRRSDAFSGDRYRNASFPVLANLALQDETVDACGVPPHHLSIGMRYSNSANDVTMSFFVLMLCAHAPDRR
jgi:hypothetical protein